MMDNVPLIKSLVALVFYCMYLTCVEYQNTEKGPNNHSLFSNSVYLVALLSKVNRGEAK